MAPVLTWPPMRDMIRSSCMLMAHAHAHTVSRHCIVSSPNKHPTNFDVSVRSRAAFVDACRKQTCSGWLHSPLHSSRFRSRLPTDSASCCAPPKSRPLPRRCFSNQSSISGPEHPLLEPVVDGPFCTAVSLLEKRGCRHVRRRRRLPERAAWFHEQLASANFADASVPGGACAPK